ncbi:predicted protein [Chaetomium globosum CBS 148.51]|uniref:ATP synthase subunit 9, mitochondrial n=1 Tax=Chaetomium globosum (strain ATCC 6205 / CBS 148.51 / DSM 1962 / NBRC 6347 / NRRL 1970) TaxID=306901 RepID=Q2HBT4_CHAGB|nr:uncharacterized protein CHGG_02320 [Chaetomium globosum CBS 148.51]EAQ90385.1 predicted protein [Chaetomium globosum CBS 148.51]
MFASSRLPGVVARMGMKQPARLMSTAQGQVFGSLISGVARNPAMRGQLFSYAVLGFAFAEATGLFALMVAFLLLYAY